MPLLEIFYKHIHQLHKNRVNLPLIHLFFQYMGILAQSYVFILKYPHKLAR